MKKSVFVFCLLTFLFIGCKTNPKRVDNLVGANQPQDYKLGFGAGCDSGYSAAGHVYYKFNKDVTKYNKEKLYQQGWDDGFKVCKGKYDSLGR